MNRGNFEQQRGINEFKYRLVSLVGFSPKTLPECLVMFYGAFWNVGH